MANHTTTSPAGERCVLHHCETRHCPPLSELVLCSSGAPGHDQTPASYVIEYDVHLSGRGDTERALLLACSHPACIADAENHAHIVGAWIDTRPLTIADAEEATGLDLSGLVSA